MRNKDTLDQMAHVIGRMNEKRLRYKDLGGVSLEPGRLIYGDGLDWRSQWDDQCVDLIYPRLFMGHVDKGFQPGVFVRSEPGFS